METINFRDLLTSKVFRYLAGDVVEGRDNKGNICYKLSYSPNNLKSLFIFPDKAFVQLHKPIMGTQSQIVNINPVDTFQEYLVNSGHSYKKTTKGDWVKDDKVRPVKNLQGLYLDNKAQNLENIFIFTTIDVERYKKSMQEEQIRNAREAQQLRVMTVTQKNKFYQDRDMNRVNYANLVKFYQDGYFADYVLQNFYNYANRSIKDEQLQKDFPRLKGIYIIKDVTYQIYQQNKEIREVFLKADEEMIKKSNHTTVYFNEDDITQYIFGLPSKYRADTEIKEYLETKRKVVEEKKEETPKKEDEEEKQLKAEFEKEVEKFEKYFRVFNKLAKIVKNRGNSAIATVKLKEEDFTRELPELYRVLDFEPKKVKPAEQGISLKEKLKYNIEQMKYFIVTSYKLLLNAFINNLVQMNDIFSNGNANTMMRMIQKDCCRVLQIPPELQQTYDALEAHYGETVLNATQSEKFNLKDSYCNVCAYLVTLFVNRGDATEMAEQKDKKYWVAVYNSSLAEYREKVQADKQAKKDKEKDEMLDTASGLFDIDTQSTEDKVKKEAPTSTVASKDLDAVSGLFDF